MGCALEQNHPRPLPPHASDPCSPCVSANLWQSAQEDVIRHGEEQRLHGDTAMADAGAGSPVLEDTVHNEQIREQIVPEMPTEALLTLEALELRTEAIVAHRDGGPRFSGHLDRITRDQITHDLIPNIIQGVENTFSKHGEKALRANCKGKLAKDETYGFLCADLVLGALIPREQAIRLGEKLRKENRKVKEKKAQLARDRARELGRLSEGE